MPLLCVRGRDAVELSCVQSLARPAKGEPTSPLLGRWGQKGTVTLPRSGDGAEGRCPRRHPPPSAARSAPAPSAPVAAAEVEEDPELAALMAELESSPPPEVPPRRGGRWTRSLPP